MAVTPDLKSFVTKFADLWHSGKNACLSLECEAGEATINLQLRLGLHPLQPQDHQGPQHHLARQAGPSRLRRRARRAQARAMAAAAEQSAAAASTKEADTAAVEAVPTRAEEAVKVVPTEAVAKVGEKKLFADVAVQAVSTVENAAVQVDRPALWLLSPPHATQGDTLPPPHLSLPAVIVPDAFCPDQDYQDNPGIPQLDGYTPSNEEWSCKCCMYETFYQTEDELEKHHDTAHSFIEYRECNICYNGHMWT